MLPARTRKRMFPPAFIIPMRPESLMQGLEQDAAEPAAGLTGARLTLTRRSGWVDSLRKYRVVLDGRDLAFVRTGEEISLSIPPGRHALVLRIDWCGSPEVHFEAWADEEVRFECESNLRGWRVFLGLFYILLATRKYIALRRLP